jgi:CBS domain containing-hemolysin-like protein
MNNSSLPLNEPPQIPADPWWGRLLVFLRLRAGPSTRAELADAIADSAAGEFSPHEHAMLQNVLKLRGKRVDDVMIPRADILAVSAEITLGELLTMFRSAGHSRLPVYGETLDDPRGMIHIRDFLDFIAASAEGSRKTTGRRRKVDMANTPSLAGVDLTLPLSSARILRQVIYAPPSMPAVDLLVRMQATRTHMALVIDEYGGTEGLVSIEDLVEMVVGNIEDEHDDENIAMIAASGPDAFTADARASLEEASAFLEVDLRAGDIGDEVDTLGGLIVTMTGRVPIRGELIAGPSNLEFEVTDADARRVKRLRIHRRQAGYAANAAIKAAKNVVAAQKETAPPASPSSGAA